MQRITKCANADDVRRAVQFRNIAVDLGITLHRHHRRAECPFCEGRSRWTISYTATALWHCHRCGRGGDIFTLVELVKGVGFKDALRFLAAVAGIPMDENSGDLQRVLAEQRDERERRRCQEEQRRSRERRKRIAARDWLHTISRVENLCVAGLDAIGFDKAASADAEPLWKLAENAHEMKRSAEAAYDEAAGLAVSNG